MSDFLHGAETIEQKSSNFIINEADISNVIIIGTAPTYLAEVDEELPHITNDTESVRYLGNNIDGFTLPDAVETILQESGGADIYTINVFDNDKHRSSVDKDITFANGECKLEEIGIQNLVLNKSEELLTAGVDYKYENNVITVLEGGKLETDQNNVKASYKYVDFSKITDSDVIGSTDKDGKRTGLQKIYDIASIYGINPGIIIVPGFTSKNVRDAVIAICEKIKAYAYLDCDNKTTLPIAEKARLNETEGIDLTCSSDRVMLLAPTVKRYNSYQDTTLDKPYSPVAAGLRVKLDRERNTAKSISNTSCVTVKGSQFPIYFKLNDKNCDANRFNAQGITTLINYKGDYKIWGTRSACFPNKNSGIESFESVRRTADFIEKSIENSSIQMVDENITKGFIDDVLNTINNAFAKWANPTDKKNNIIYSGEAWYDAGLNPAESIAAGHIIFPYKFCPLGVAERITFYSQIDISLITKALGE